MSQPVVVAEPALYSFGGFSEGERLDEHFRDFVSRFRRVDAFVRLNAVSLACTRELFEQISLLFPYLPPGTGELKGGSGEVSLLISKFLEEFVVKPWRAYALGDELVLDVSPRCEPQTGVYTDPSLLMAWHDLLAQCCLLDSSSTLILLGKPPLSFAPADTVELVVRGHSGEIRQHPALRVDQSLTQRGLLDPAPFQALTERARERALPPDIDYEKSGHQPSRVIKQILERTARTSPIVMRMVTTYCHPALSDSCKIRASEGTDSALKYSQLSYRISDRQMTVKGYFTTCARTEEELRTACVVVGREFRRRCLETGLDWQD